MSGYTTHVANACSQEIAVSVTVNKQFVTSQKSGGSLSVGVDGAEVSASGNSETDYTYLYHEPGFTKIAPRQFLGFHISGDDGGVYVSAVTKAGKLIADDFRVRNDYSIIVDANETLQETEYGKIWVDITGKRH